MLKSRIVFKMHSYEDLKGLFKENLQNDIHRETVFLSVSVLRYEMVFKMKNENS